MDKSLKPRIYKPSEKDFSHNGLGILRDATRADVREQANGVYELEVEYPLKSRFKQYFENGYQIKAKPNDQEEYHIFEIKRTYEDTIGNNILIYAQSRTYKLGNRQVQHVEIDSKTGVDAMRAITAGMDLQSDIELYSDITTVSSTLFEARNVLNCIAGEQGSLLQFWGGEIKREPFKLSLLRRRGRDKVGTVRYGKDLQGLKITFDWQSIVTRCLPYADLQNNDDGQTKRIYGDPVNSDLIANYPDIYARHVQFTEEQGVTDKASLDRVAKNYFKSTNVGIDKPKVSIELEIEKLTDSEEAKEFARLRNYGLFDTFSVYHKLYDIYVEAKITEVTYDSLNEKTKKVRAGDAQIAFYKQQNNELQETIKTLTKKGYMSEFVDYVTNLINGVEGGSVLQYPKNKPHTTYYMDTNSRETAKDVIAINNQGMGFSRTGWLGPFVNAWGIDGTLNADFIRAGKIRANIFETSFNAVGDQLKMVAGAIQAWNDSKKIMELTKKGLEFWNEDVELGAIGVTDSIGNPFPDAVASEPLEGNSIVIRGNRKFILISPTEGKGLVFLPGGGAIHYGDLNIQGDLRVYGSVDIQGSLRVSGQTIGGANDGGGDNSGGLISGNWTDGSIVNGSRSISQDNINLVLKYAGERNIRPSYVITQMFIESHWGDPNTSTVGSVDNNWSGISEPFSPPASLGINMSRGSARPANEGGYYVHFATLEDYFKAHAYVISKQNGYNVEGKRTIEDYTKGLFRVGGANHDYAASGYEHYLGLMVPTYNAIKSQNPGKLEELDRLIGKGSGSDPSGNSKIDTMIQWMIDRQGRSRSVYTNARPWGGGSPPQYDCSAAVIEAMQQAGIIADTGNYGWTGTLKSDILPKNARQISRSEAKKGDIFLSKYWAFDGHTGFFLSNSQVIHMNYGAGTISTTKVEGYIGPAPHEYWRLNIND